MPFNNEITTKLRATGELIESCVSIKEKNIQIRPTSDNLQRRQITARW